MAAFQASRDATACFERCQKKLMVFVFKEDEGTRTSLNLLLDELIALDCNSFAVTTETGNSLLQRLCNLVPLKHDRLITKVCQVIHNFIKYRLVASVKGETRQQLCDLLMRVLRTCADWAIVDVLRVTAVVLDEHWEPFMQRLFQHQDVLMGLLIGVLTAPSPDVASLGEATHCLKCLAYRTTDKEGLSRVNAVTCFSALLNLLHALPALDLHHALLCRVAVDALLGMSSLVNARVEVEPHVGQLLAAVKGYMFHGLGPAASIPRELFPTMASGFQSKSPKTPTSTPSPASAPAKPGHQQQSTSNSTPTSTKSKNKKTRKKKSGAGNNNEPSSASASASNGRVASASAREDAEEDPESDKPGGGGGGGWGGGVTTGLESPSLQPAWARLTSSDSEVSDSDAGGQAAKSHSHSTKVRLAALSCMASVCKLVDKRAMFGYWPFFIPDSAAAGNSPQVQTLFTSILKDPSPKCRMGALVSLTAMLDGTKHFLVAAEESSNARTAFTPLSSVLGAMIREMHRALLQALVVENYNLSLTQLIKCLATLVVNVPYHRLQPGLLTRVVKQIRHFLSHKDSNVRVACLTCLGALASHQPPLMEVFHIVQSPAPPVGMTTALNSIPLSALSDSSGVDTQGGSNPSLSSGSVDVGSSSSGSSNPIPIRVPTTSAGSAGSSGQVTPTLGASPGIHTPVFSDQFLQAQGHDTSWLVKLCIRNILPQPTPSPSTTPTKTPGPSGGGGGGVGRGEGEGGGSVEPLPVRLESLQVMATLTRGYFSIIRSQLALMQELIHKCLEDSDATIKLHGCKVLEELGTVMIEDIREGQTAASPSSRSLTVQQARSLWESVLDGPLLKILQRTDSTNPLRAGVCDCVANIGAEVFILLETQQQRLCLKQVLGLTLSADRLVMSAAVRALGFLVLYPCLSQDVGFMAEAANAVLKCMAVPSINVKIKAAWALGNLCDALVVNKDKGDRWFMDQFSDMLLSSMLTSATKATLDRDKVKCNAVRAVGNILRYLPHRSLGKSHMVEAVAGSVKVIISSMNSGPMKVRWNSCYAMANMLKNPLLLTGDTPWLVAVLTALSAVVKDCNNFKVRINSALALCVPAQRHHYGDTALYVTVWQSLAQSLRTADNITDFAGFRYRDSLTEQVCLALLHMLSVCEATDITPLLPLLKSEGLSLQEGMHRFLTDKAPAKVSAVQKAQQRLTELDKDPGKTEDVATGLMLLLQVCQIDEEEEGTENNISPHVPTGFRQIYD